MGRYRGVGHGPLAWLTDSRNHIDTPPRGEWGRSHYVGSGRDLRTRGFSQRLGHFDKNGDVGLRPGTTVETAWHSRTFPLADYRFGDDHSRV